MSPGPTGRHRIVVATPDTLTSHMAGPAIRAWQIASALSREHDVQLVSTTRADASHPDFTVAAVDDADLAELEQWCDVFVFQGWVIRNRPYLVESDKILVADVYDPLHLEQLEQGRDDGPRARLHTVEAATATLNEQLLRADFFLCASERQRYFWLGHLAALGRITPLIYDKDPSLRSVIAVAPFGITETPPVHTRSRVKGVMPGIGPDARLILWGGGIYNWFDPLTLIRAVDRLRRRVPHVRLLFMGVRHPNDEIPTMGMARAARRLADELGLTGTHVFFNDGWVAYEDRQNHLLEADVGVSTHLDCLEADLSYRTRVLDYLWASLPVVCTRGDALADLVESRQLGITVPAGDVDGLEGALASMLEDEGRRASARAHIAAVVPELVWSRALDPLLSFCRDPRRSGDAPTTAARLRAAAAAGTAVPDRWLGLRHDMRTAREYFRAGGPGLLASKALGRMSRMARRRQEPSAGA